MIAYIDAHKDQFGVEPIEFEQAYDATHNPSPTTVEEERLTLH